MSDPRHRIGFVDLDVDNFHADTYLAAIHGPLADRGFTVAGCTARDTERGRNWAERQGVRFFESARELNEHVDSFMVLAPSNPEVHLPLCREVLPFGKPTFVDKPVASDLAEAEAIYDLADAHGAPVQTTSALRFTNVQAELAAQPSPAQHVIAFGSGRSFEEYGIHPVEMAVSCLGPEVVSLMRRGTDRYVQLLINFTLGRTAVVNLDLAGRTPYAACVTTAEGTRLIEVQRKAIFTDTAAAILDFFAAAAPNIDRCESLAIRRILDAAADPAATAGFVPIDEPGISRQQARAAASQSDE